jgi:ceramide glucosyltransferase
MDWLVVGYWALSVFVIGAAALLTLQTWEHFRFVRGRAVSFSACPAGYYGPIALVVACKGVDVDLEGNLRPLFEQDYENYELIFSVESGDDPACPTIRKLMAQYPGFVARLVVAGIANKSGQKVHNLLAATEQLRADIAVVAFVDADARPPRDWLRLLTHRLDHSAAATGYRCFVPKRPRLANHILASIDASVVAIMFPSPFRKVWGGSWTVRREVFEEIQLRAAWHGTLSDDLVAGRELARRRKRVALESACILPSPLDVDMRQMFAFARRQFTIGRYYSPALWSIALVWQCAAQGVFWGSLTLAAWGLVARAPWALQPASVVGLVYVLHVCRAWLRQRASRFYLPNWQEELAGARRFDIWFGPVAGLACGLALVSSAFGRYIAWKGIAYELRRGGRVVRILPASGVSKSTPSAHEAKSAVPTQTVA